jgi:hypothetical protein
MNCIGIHRRLAVLFGTFIAEIKHAEVTVPYLVLWAGIPESFAYIALVVAIRIVLRKISR